MIDRELLMYSLDHHKAPDRAPPGHGRFMLYTDAGVAEELFARSAPKTRHRAIIPILIRINDCQHAGVPANFSW